MSDLLGRNEIHELRIEVREAMDRFSSTLEDIRTIVGDHSVLIARLVERDEEHKRNIERFWKSDWQRVENQCLTHRQGSAATERTLITLQSEVATCVRVLQETVVTVQQIQEARWKMAGAFGIIAFLAGIVGSVLAG